MYIKINLKKEEECKTSGNSMVRLDLAFSMVSVTQDTSMVLDKVQAMIFLENKSMILVKYTNPSVVQIYVISLQILRLAAQG